jgi:hypothetical protein
MGVASILRCPPKKQPGVCAEKARLTHEVVDAIKLIISFHLQELKHILKGKTSTFDQRGYEKALEMKLIFERQLRDHRTMHGC